MAEDLAPDEPRLEWQVGFRRTLPPTPIPLTRRTPATKAEEGTDTAPPEAQEPLIPTETTEQ